MISETENSLITLCETLISFLISIFFIHSDKASTFPDSNNSPFLNKSIISLGPEGQSDDIIFLPKICASINEFPKPSLLEGKKNISADFKYLRGLSTFPRNFKGKSG